MNALLIPKLQSYFAKFLHLLSPIALVYSTHPPVLDFIYFTGPQHSQGPTVLTYFLFLALPKFPWRTFFGTSKK